MRRAITLLTVCLALPAGAHASDEARFRCPPSLSAPGYCGDGRAAARSGLDRPADVAVERDGSVLIADAGNKAIRRVRLGRIHKVADSDLTLALAMGRAGEAIRLGYNQLTSDRRTVGTGRSGYRDYEDARFGHFSIPRDVAVAPDGTIVIADTYNHRVRAVRRDGSLVTIAGNGEPGTSGDGGPALAARLDRPRAVAAMADGAVIVATGEGRLRRIAPDGNISRVGTRDFLRGVSLAALADGTVAVGVPRARRVLKVAMDGSRTVLAKGGRCGMPDARRRPAAAGFNAISGLAVAPDGAVLVADAGSHRVLRVTASEVEVVAGGGLRPPARCEAIPFLPRARASVQVDPAPTVYELTGAQEPGTGEQVLDDASGKLDTSKGCAGRRGRRFDVSFAFASPNRPRAGKPFVLAYNVGTRASVTVTATGRVKRSARTVSGGLVTVRFGGMPAGRYRLTFRAAAKGQTLCLAGKLIVR